MWGAAPVLAHILLVWYQLGAAIVAMRTSSGKLIRTPGDVVFGGIFPMHEHDPDRRTSTCGAVKEEKGVQRLEAMLYAIDAINADQNILPNVTIGALILDSCSSAPYALEQSMEFVRSYMNQVGFESILPRSTQSAVITEICFSELFILWVWKSNGAST